MVQNISSSEVINIILDLFSKGFATSYRRVGWYSFDLLYGYERAI